MADGRGCKCAAHSEAECGCDADWTPQELIEARVEIARLRLKPAEREFFQNLRGAYEELANQTGYVNAASQKEARDYADLLRGLLERTK